MKRKKLAFFVFKLSSKTQGTAIPYLCTVIQLKMKNRHQWNCLILEPSLGFPPVNIIFPVPAVPSSAFNTNILDAVLMIQVSNCLVPVNIV